MEEGTLAKWLVKEGDTVSSGDIMAEIETDKATMEFEAVDEGMVGKILIAEGTEGVKVNTAIADPAGRRRRCADDIASAAPTAAAPAAAEAPAPRRRPHRRTRRARDRPHTGLARRHHAETADRPRGAARRHGRGNAPRSTASS